MNRSPSSASNLAASVIASAIDRDGGVLTTIQLLAMGDTRPRNGVPARIVLADRAHADQVVAASESYAGATEPMIDYDHQSVFAANSRVGGRAPAAGWIKKLMARDDGIWAEVEWTAAAASALAQREYRYISPYFHIERGTGRVTRIINAGLTNTPNLDLAAVASASENTGDAFPMNMSRIAEALGLSADAAEDEILAAIADWKSAKATMAATASALGLAADAVAEELLKAANAAFAASTNPDPAKFVPVADLKAVQTELGKIRDQRVTASVDAAVSSGKLLPAQRDWALKLGLADEAQLDAFLATATPLLRAGAQLDDQIDPKSDTLSESERAVCSALGVSTEDFLAARKEQEA